MNDTLNPLGVWLQQQLAAVTSRKKSSPEGDTFTVVGAGGSVTAAYEQLRNAAENAEEHLLLQNAIYRFYRQAFMMHDDGLIRESGPELVTELTMAGYLPNNSVSNIKVKQVSALAIDYFSVFTQLHQSSKVAPNKLNAWVVGVLAAQVEALLNNHDNDEIFVEFATYYFDQLLDADYLASQFDCSIDEYRQAMFVAIHRVLLRSNETLIRAQLLARYQVGPQAIETFVTYNQQIDQLFELPVVDRLRRIINRQGAPLRVLRRMIEDTPEAVDQLSRKSMFLELYERQVQREYGRAEARIKKAVIRSIIFLIVTKVLIGVAVEVPYDLIVHGSILWLPLAINLLFPPLYMIMLQGTNRLPSPRNTRALVDHVDMMLYGTVQRLPKSRLTQRQYSSVFSVIYTVSSLAIFGGLLWILAKLGFTAVHMIIFFVFFSAASFLGFRISRSITELEIVRTSQDGVTFLRDLLYLPFVAVGQWMSDKYARVNIVANILDVVIEMPLKTVLRLIRQWASFLDDRKDRI